MLERFRKLQKFHFTQGDIDHEQNLEYSCETRWYTQRKAVMSVLKNRRVLETLSVQLPLFSGKSVRKAENFLEYVAHSSLGILPNYW